jgi:hypothetical protein
MGKHGRFAFWRPPVLLGAHRRNFLRPSWLGLCIINFISYLCCMMSHEILFKRKIIVFISGSFAERSRGIPFVAERASCAILATFVLRASKGPASCAVSMG